ncbi:hypothetical protein ACFVSW_26650 [Neobacillus sp. NPDC058068]|uniref:hypothetical protein n=1 Tax=Neobacillus sp. NPDC058068 TaxID=3346325 RepID=UPI0036DE79F0
MAHEQVNFDDLLVEYRSIWNNRILLTEEIGSKEILIEAIKRELLDENSHPRVRKSRYEKYYSAIKRVMNSSISAEMKLRLIKIHVEILEELS